ncbi:MAG: hypothetical protein K2G22_07805, partial [Eubacterium sp.]|nr:hypothetical protein [Eubacterium sp.]
FSTIAYANEVQPRITFIGSLQVVSAPIAGSSGIAGLSGHSFIIVKNTSDSTITVGHMPVNAGDSVTIGTYGNRSAHKGIWYNIESYCGLKGTSYGLTSALTLNDLNAINKVINDNDKWTNIYNCSYFAKIVWNTLFPTKTISGTDPLTLANSIKSKDNYITDPTIPHKNKDKIARHTTSGYVYDSSGATAT